MSPRERSPRERRKRTVIVGDVHGCRAELERLLEGVDFQNGLDRLVFVGDLVARGPDSLGVLALARATNALVVRGNHEERVLREAHKGLSNDGTRPGVHRDLAESLGDEDWKLLEATPLSAHLPEHGLTVVHAGIDPALPFAAQDPETLLFVRHARGRERSGKKVLWGEAYGGPMPYVFGHNAIEKLQLHPFATGLDTGCVYGGKLTALVLDEGEKIPEDTEARKTKLVSVPAERVHFAPIAKGAKED
jgi:hypothetical protein